MNLRLKTIFILGAFLLSNAFMFIIGVKLGRWQVAVHLVLNNAVNMERLKDNAAAGRIDKEKDAGSFDCWDSFLRLDSSLDDHRNEFGD